MGTPEHAQRPRIAIGVGSVTKWNSAFSERTIAGQPLGVPVETSITRAPLCSYRPHCTALVAPQVSIRSCEDRAKREKHLINHQFEQSCA